MSGCAKLNKRRALVAKMVRDRQERVDQLIDNWQRSRHIVEVTDETEGETATPTAKDRRLIRRARELARQ